MAIFSFEMWTTTSCAGSTPAPTGRGLSRNEYLRREVVKLAQVSGQDVTREDLKRSLELLTDLGDESVMGRAW
jgi:hypothetical protein